jgi:hypothetical protein
MGLSAFNRARERQARERAEQEKANSRVEQKTDVAISLNDEQSKTPVVTDDKETSKKTRRGK